MIMHVWEVQREKTGGKAHDRIHQEVVTRSISLAAHPRRCQFYEATLDQQ